MKIRLLTWNLHSQRYSPYEWKERFPLIVKTICDCDPTMIVLQEVEESMKKDLIDYLHIPTVLPGVMRISYVPKINNEDGILMLSRPIVYPKKSSFRLTEDGNQVASIWHFKPTLNSPPDHLIVSLHLKSKERNYQIRKQQIDNLLTHIRTNYPETNTIIIAGDFNEDPQEPNSQVYQTLANYGFHHAYPTSTKTTKKIDHEGTPVHRKIDWIWVKTDQPHLNITPLLKVDQETDLPNLEAGYPSDHHPLAAEITISPKYQLQ